MKTLNTPSKELEEIKLSSLLGLLTKKFGEGWADLDNETISIELDLLLTPLLTDKIEVLRVQTFLPETFYEDFLFFVHSVECINNTVADFEHLPIPTSLELAYAIHEMAKIFPGSFGEPMKNAITRMLKDEGYSVAPPPLDQACFPEKLEEGQEMEDRDAKADAIDQYIKYMDEKQ